MARFWFTLDEKEEILLADHIGNIRGARRKAQEAANYFHDTVYINKDENIIETVFPD